MTDLSKKQEDFQAFFMLKSEIRVNLQWTGLTNVPSADELLSNMPEGFRLLNAVADIKRTALAPIPSLGKAGEQLVEYLQLQGQKVDLLLANMLLQDDAPEHRHYTSAFGAAGCQVIMESVPTLGAIAEVKIFIERESVAVFCYGEVIACEEINDAEKNQTRVSILFSRIREEDQEALVRATMHIQSEQLRKRQSAN